MFDGSIERISCVTQHQEYIDLTKRVVLENVGPLLGDKNHRPVQKTGWREYGCVNILDLSNLLGLDDGLVSIETIFSAGSNNQNDDSVFRYISEGCVIQMDC